MKKRIKNFLFYSLLFLFIIMFIFCSYKIIKWYMDSYKNKKIVEDLNNSTEIEETKPNENVEPINPPTEEADDYWDFIKQPYISVNFDSLKERNNDTVGWIYINNTNINYPIVQSNNNDFYLTHAFDKTWNGAGWIYMDYRNNVTNFDTNTIIYGHSMIDKSMFGTLLNARYEWWYTNKDNQVIKLSTPYQNTLWRIFSIYIIEPENYYLTTTFSNDNSKIKFFDTLKKRSKYNFEVELDEKDKIITLSTCNTSDSSERLVVHAKLISLDNR